jgi:endonuclease/exonuclease/phosphatase family metal-dependent hydrolase
MKRPGDSPIASLLQDSVLAFAFFSALTGFVEATYIFGLLGTDIPPEIAFVLFLLSPFLLLAFPRVIERRTLMRASGSLALLLWAASIPLSTRWRMLASGVACGLFLVHAVCRARGAGRNPSGLVLGAGSGVLLSMLFRAAHSGNLFLDDAVSYAVCIVLALAGILLLIFTRPEAGAEAEPGAPEAKHRSLRALVFSMGLFGGLALLYFAFTSPAVMARWIGAGYPAVIAVETGALVAFTAAWLFMPGFRAALSPGLLAAWNVVFIALLAVVLRLLQPQLGEGAAFPVYAAEPGAFVKALFWAMLALHPVIYADIALLASALRAEKPSLRGLVRGFAFGSLFLLLLVFSQIFTTVYDYIPVIGPWFRDRFWLVMCVPGAALTLSVLFLKRPQAEGCARPHTVRAAWTIGMAAAACAAVLVAVFTAARPAPAAAAGDGSLRVLTFNIQQGCSSTGEISVRQQVEAVRALEPDVVGLEETDTARAAGGNSDVVRLFADGLGMHSYYGPSPVAGTFGVALLSRYPIRSARTFFMPSRGEQTAAIEAEIDVGGKAFRLIVTHLDNDGALPQQRLVIEAAQSAVRGGAAVIAMGDFNFDPSTEQYALTSALLGDAWMLGGERATVGPGAPDPKGRIDHIFVSGGIRVLAARYLPRGLSDHPAMFAEIGW